MTATAIVGITATTKVIEGFPRVRLNEAYVHAVARAGLVPLVIPPLAHPDADVILDAVAGLVLSGGEDVDPAEYGAPNSGSETSHALRDRTELALARRARERRMPVLAICRGIQVMNVALGGTLIQDIPSEVPGALTHDQSARRRERVHDIAATKASALAQALGAATLRVNSSHHQALESVAQGLTVSARAPDGVIEGVEWTADDWWMLGVQWHPEELVEDPEPWDLNLFRAFAARVTPRP